MRCEVGEQLGGWFRGVPAQVVGAHCHPHRRMAASHRDRLVGRTIDDIETPALLSLLWKGTHSPAVLESLVRSRRAFNGSDPS